MATMPCAALALLLGACILMAWTMVGLRRQGTVQVVLWGVGTPASPLPPVHMVKEPFVTIPRPLATATSSLQPLSLQPFPQPTQPRELPPIGATRRLVLARASQTVPAHPAVPMSIWAPNPTTPLQPNMDGPMLALAWSLSGALVVVFFITRGRRSHQRTQYPSGTLPWVTRNTSAPQAPWDTTVAGPVSSVFRASNAEDWDDAELDDELDDAQVEEIDRQTKAYIEQQQRSAQASTNNRRRGQRPTGRPLPL